MRTNRLATQRTSKPIVWLGQSVDTSAICANHPELRGAHFLTSLGCAIRRPSLKQSHFTSELRTKLGISGPLMVDSGGFALSTNPQARWTVRNVSDAYSEIDADVFVALDYPPSARDTPSDRSKKIRASMRNFSILSERLPAKTIMPVVHGRTLSEVNLSVDLLSKTFVKHRWIGMGGLVPLLLRRRVSKEIADMGAEVFIAKAVASVRSAFPDSLIHAFGAGGTRTFPALFALGADSADSIGWRQAAGFGSIFLPMKSQRTVVWNIQKDPPRKRLDESDIAHLEMCRCPICSAAKHIKGRLRALHAHFYARSIHNAWTIVNQVDHWPSTRSQMKSFVANGGLGQEWAKAVISAR